MSNRRSDQKDPEVMQEDDDAFNDMPYLESSGLVSDPVPHTRRPSKALSKADELRLQALKREVFQQAPDIHPLTETDIPSLDQVQPVADVEDRTEAPEQEPGTGVIMVDEVNEGLAAAALAEAVHAVADVVSDRLAPQSPAPFSEPVDPWLQDILDEQKKTAGKKKDFSKYQGHFARLNDFAVPGALPRGGHEPAEPALKVISEEERRKQAEADRSRFVESDDEGVDVHPRELLSASMYDDLVNWSSRLARETPMFNRAFSAGSTVSVCDVGCGSGRHCVMFAQWGMKVLGLDRSPSMLKRAHVAADEAAADIAEAQGSLSFKKAHLGGVAAAVGPERIEAIICVGDVLPHVESLTALRETLSDFADALLPSGILVLEFTNHMHYLQNRIRTTTPVVFDTTEGTRVFLTVLDYPPGSVMVDTENLSLTHGKDGKWKARSEHMMNLFISPDGIERELLAAGFDILEMAGDFNGKPLAPLQDESIVVIARRKRHRPSAKRRAARTAEEE